MVIFQNIGFHSPSAISAAEQRILGTYSGLT